MATAALNTNKDLPLLPVAKASWLVDNTALTFDQIADFCGMHPTTVDAIANGDPGFNMQGMSPLDAGELSADEIARCEADTNARLKKIKRGNPAPSTRAKGPRYTPVSKRADKPDGVAWLLRYHPEFSDTQIAKLIGSTKGTVSSIRDRSHSDIINIKPRDPVFLGLCKQEELTALVNKYGKKQAPEQDDQPEYQPDMGAGDQPDIGDWEQ